MYTCIVQLCLVQLIHVCIADNVIHSSQLNEHIIYASVTLSPGSIVWLCVCVGSASVQCGWRNVLEDSIQLASNAITAGHSDCSHYVECAV